MIDMNDSKVLLILMAVGILVRVISAAIKESNWLKEAQERQEKRFENAAPPKRNIPDGPNWHPNGWYYDEKKEKWIAPDYQYVKDGQFKPEYEAEHGAKSPTGWTYDRDKLKWEPPKELAKESARKWRWDEEKRIWIDQDKEARQQRYKEYWKDKRKEPTYEEWRAAKLAEEKALSAPAPGPKGTLET